MDHAVSSFFHNICGVILFAAAVTGLVFETQRLTEYIEVQLCRVAEVAITVCCTEQ